jgi:hypothetical protein
LRPDSSFRYKTSSAFSATDDRGDEF